MQLKKTYDVALVQMDSGENKEKNLEKAVAAVEEAVKYGAKLICFPELMNGEASAENVAEMAESSGGKTISVLRKKAKEHKVYIHTGSMYERIEGENRCYNTSMLLNKDGQIVSTYRKIHMFDVTLTDGTVCAESHNIKPGKEIVTVETELGKLGFAVCYDIRFPELFRKMALDGAQVIIVPASFTLSTGKDHWEPLLRARAIENSCYILATDQIGEKNSYSAFGNSMVIDPWGTVLSRAGNREEIVYARIDLEYEKKVREMVPSLKNRREDVYLAVNKNR